MKTEIRVGDLPKLEHAMKSVDPDAKVVVDVGEQSVSIASSLMPEEFLVAFNDDDYDVPITEW